MVMVRQHGYGEREFSCTLNSLQQELKMLVKKEFPRSRKLRLYHIDGLEQSDLPRKKL